MTVISPKSGAQIPTKGDMALGGSLLVVAILSGLFIDAARPDTIEPSSWWHWLLISVPPVLVAVRRLNPVLITVLATAAQASIWISDLPEVLLSMIVILYTVASEAGERGLRVAIGSSVALTAVTAVGVRIADDVTVYQLPLIVLTCGTAIVLGVHAARQRSLTGELATQVAETRLRNEHERASAIAEERSHIARELHDIIGHSLSTIAVRAEAADRVGQQRPDVAQDAVTAIAGAARSALTETRRVLTGLRQSGDLALTPPPDVDAIRRLVADLASAGVGVSLTTVGCDKYPPSPVVAGGAYRIIQESLTNAVRHAGPDVTISVALTCGGGELDVTVTDDGPGHSVERSDGTGAGLTGMAERAAVLGGSFEAENRQSGGFVVHVVLPMDRDPVTASPTTQVKP